MLGGALVLSAVALSQSIECSVDDSASLIAGDPQTGHNYGNSNPQGKAKGHRSNC